MEFVAYAVDSFQNEAETAIFGQRENALVSRYHCQMLTQRFIVDQIVWINEIGRIEIETIFRQTKRVDHSIDQTLNEKKIF